MDSWRPGGRPDCNYIKATGLLHFCRTFNIYFPENHKMYSPKVLLYGTILVAQMFTALAAPSIDRNGKHPEKSAKLDIMIMAQRLSRTGSVALHSGRTVKYEAADILYLGAARVAGDALVKFNGTECSSSQYSFTETDDSALEGENEDEGEVAQFFATDGIE